MAILIFAIFVAVQQTGTADTLFNVLLMGAVGAVARALGPFFDP